MSLARLMEGYVTTQLLYVAARLGFADELKDGPRSAAELAAATGAAPSPVHRVLRGLAAQGVVEEEADGRFALTELGAPLRSDAADSLRGAVIARGDLYYVAAARTLDAVREGGTAFERTYGETLFEHLAARPERAAEFHRSMADRSRREAAAVVAAYDFTRFRRLVDVGGGNGILLAAILAAAPELRGVLFDQPGAIEAARAHASGRVQLAAGDFFDSVPAGGDAYLLSRVIHDWDDERARAILTTCHRAMEPGTPLLLVEAVLPERAVDGPLAITMDLHMLMLLGGRERTAAQYEELLTATGFRPSKMTPTGSPTGLAIVEAIRWG
jgi:hypothetical protein